MSDQLGLLGGSSDDAGGDALVLADFAERAYLDYAVSVVKGRALPDVCDGLKPVQRRILFAMDAMGLAANAKPVKSARVVGDVLGRFHPHGDQSAYDALVRLAQDFVLRYPLIDGQGNFGSRDGDGAAAMRYTEARLTPFARVLLDEIGEGTVDFVPNYDGSTQEPALLPARLPVVLLNGASGIAVGLATEIPPHNLREVGAAAIAMIKQPDLSLDSLMQLLPGPDFPGGGQLISSPEEIRDAYAQGRGSLKMRARYVFEELARGQWQLVVNELPHGVSCSKILEEIEDFTNPKIKAGRKALSPDQVQMKQNMLGLLDAARDESSREAAVRLVFEPRSSRQDRDEFVQTLLAHTSLETSVPMNLVVVDRQGKPGQRSVQHVLADWIDFRTQTVTRRTQHRLTKVDDRIHILEGRQLILLNIDEVIAIIRESDEPKQALIARFKLSDRQAEDILEIRLRQLARLEAIKIEQELSNLRDEREKLTDLLANPAAMKRLLIREIEADVKAFGDDRRTLIEAARRASVEVKAVDEPVTVIVSRNGWVRARQGHQFDAQALSFKSGDGLLAALPCRTVDPLIAVAPRGRVYSLAVSTLPGGRGDGQPLASLIDLESGVRPEHFLAGAANTRVMIVMTSGVGFVTTIGDMTTRQRGGKQFLTLDDGDQILSISPIADAVTDLVCLSSAGRLLVFPFDEVKVLAAGGRGTTLMQTDDAQLLAALAVPADALTKDGAWRLQVEGTGRGGKEMSLPLEARHLVEFRAKRAKKGKPLEIKWKAERLTLTQQAVAGAAS